MEFIKGHMGGNQIILINGDEINPGEELKTALKALDSKSIGGHQAGIIGKFRDGVLPVKIVRYSWRDFIPACGGLTQVLGVALIEGGAAERYGITVKQSPLKVTLGFDCGPVPLEIHFDNKGVKKVETDLSSFIGECEKEGIEVVNLDGFKAYKSGNFFVVDGDAIGKAYPDSNFHIMDDETKKIFNKVQKQFQQKIGDETWNAALYDFYSSNQADVRVLFPHRLSMGHVETACGTGSIALALALVKLANFRPYVEDSVVTLLFETGGDNILGGDEITTVKITEESGKIVKAVFSHSVVEMIAKGELYI